ncbi:Clostripain [termite gut metagenome]|uniref:Clostripain n=1 Tax=termite gut metagenome TaxID=433724 RepID=A0A5J4RAW4_9ZZZZ
MKVMKIVGFLCLLVVFNSCCGNGSEPEPPLEGRTVLIYLAADNSLSLFSENDMDEMMEGVAELGNEADNLIVYVDNYSGKPQLVRLKKDETGVGVQEVIWTYENQNSVNKEVMKEVFSRTFTDFPAGEYGLVLWSHGEGWLPATSRATSRSFGQDGSLKMNISDLHEVLKDYHFDFILFDACFMQSVEVIYELRDCSDSFIGSSTEIPGPGAPYQNTVKALFADKSTVAVDVARSYYEYYAAKYNGGINMSNNNWTGGISISVVKSDGLEPLAEATNSIFTRYLNSQTTIDVSGIISEIMCYDPLRSPSYYYDMDGFIGLLTESNADYTAWQKAYGDAVVYFETTKKNFSALGITGMISMEGAEGLSIYIPKKDLTSTNTFYRSYAWYTAAGWDKTGLFQ